MKWKYGKKIIEAELENFSFEGIDLYEYIQEVYDTQSNIDVFLIDSENKKLLIQKNKSLADQGINNESELLIIQHNSQESSQLNKEELKADKFNKKLETIADNQALLLESIQSQNNQNAITKIEETVIKPSTIIPTKCNQNNLKFEKYLKIEETDNELDIELKQLMQQKFNLLKERQALRLEHEECINDKFFKDFIQSIQKSYRQDIERRNLEILENQQKILEKEQKLKIENCQSLQSDTDQVNQQQFDFLYILDLRKQLRALQYDKEKKLKELSKIEKDKISEKEQVLAELKKQNYQSQLIIEFQSKIQENIQLKQQQQQRINTEYNQQDFKLKQLDQIEKANQNEISKNDYSFQLRKELQNLTQSQIQLEQQQKQILNRNYNQQDSFNKQNLQFFNW